MTIQNARDLLNSVCGKQLSRNGRCEKAILLASYLLDEALKQTNDEDKKREKKLAKMMEDPQGKAFVTAFTDQSFRSSNPSRTADQIAFLIAQFGIPNFVPLTEKAALLLFRTLGTAFPHFFVNMAKKRLYREFSPVLLPDDPKERQLFFSLCREQGIIINLNHLGEAILGEEEANQRLQLYIKDLENSTIQCVSIKISSIFSQIHLLAWEESLNTLAERLRKLYRTAIKHGHKFVNLDMEEYRDLDLTVALFQMVLSEPEFASLTAGIVLQSYLPDAFSVQKKLTEWALKRSAPIKIRLVKGANLAAELVESSIKGWSPPTFTEKSDTDANFKRMLEFGLDPKHVKKVKIGVGSHNLFDICYALLLRSENAVEAEVGFEMLHGMAPPLQRVIFQLTRDLLLYTPEVRKREFHTAVAYLTRRLDENTGQQNFLRDLFLLVSEEEKGKWQRQVSFFSQACEKIDVLPETRKRTQNRLTEKIKEEISTFENEPDTDLSIEENRRWAREIYAAWKDRKIELIPSVIDGKVVYTHSGEGFDPSRPEKPFYRYSLASQNDVDLALSCAQTHIDALNIEKRIAILGRAAALFRLRRGDLIGAMIADAGKTFSEADTEVSEAIDFIDYYRLEWRSLLRETPDLFFAPKGVVLVAPPWNFPSSIPVSGITAALLPGNAVIFKPAPETILVGWMLVQLFWEAGIPKELLQFLVCPDEPVGSALIKDPRLSTVILTGATETARKFLRMRPGLDLLAETGGKNAMILTALSDRDLALRDLLQSAFGHAGQKCSALSLLILEKELYEDRHFLKNLKEAAESLSVGTAWDLKTVIPPLIRPASGALLRGLTQLDPGESWLVEPKQNAKNPQLWSPGIKLGVKQNSFTHSTELFGPVLGVICAHDLDHALEIANATPYGLTSGLHSLDEREHEKWKKKIVAGNLYIDRTITGAIVRRQPFGGTKASSYGPGAKAGGPNYVAQTALKKIIKKPREQAPFPECAERMLPAVIAAGLSEDEVADWKLAVHNYAYWVTKLCTPMDSSQVIGQDNFFYHAPHDKILLRMDAKDSLLDFFLSLAAGLICGTTVTISSNHPRLAQMKSSLSQFFEEDEAMFHEKLFRGEFSRVRLLHPPDRKCLKAASESGTYLISSLVLLNGRFELLHYLREISLSINYHRYGNLGLREQTFS